MEIKFANSHRAVAYGNDTEIARFLCQYNGYNEKVLWVQEEATFGLSKSKIKS